MSTTTTLRRAAILTAATIGLSGCSQLGVQDWFSSNQATETGDYATASIPETSSLPTVETGVAAWDGDISSPGMTAAHASMAPGSWARVTNATTGQSAVVKITRPLNGNRGRTIELSRDAAAAVGALHDGLATVLIEPIDPRQSTPTERLWVRADQSAPAAPAVETVREQPRPLPQGFQQTGYQRQAAASAAPQTGGGIDYDPNLSTASIPNRSNYGYQPPRQATAGLGFGVRYLQLGSYRDAANAQRMLDRLNREGMTNGVYGDGFVETAYVGGSVYHRVRLGPIETDAEAQRALRDAKALGHNGARVLRP